MKNKLPMVVVVKSDEVPRDGGLLWELAEGADGRRPVWGIYDLVQRTRW